MHSATSNLIVTIIYAIDIYLNLRIDLLQYINLYLFDIVSDILFMISTI